MGNCRLLSFEKRHVKEHRQKVNHLIDSLESEVFQLTLNTEQTFTKMLGLVEQIKTDKEILCKTEFSLEEFLEKQAFLDKFRNFWLDPIVLFSLMLIFHLFYE